VHVDNKNYSSATNLLPTDILNRQVMYGKCNSLFFPIVTYIRVKTNVGQIDFVHRKLIGSLDGCGYLLVDLM